MYVEYTGPPVPPETMNAWSKILSAPMPKTTSTKKWAGLSSGNVIRQNVRQVPVPSTAAAS